jgi:hypothetical protein
MRELPAPTLPITDLRVFSQYVNIAGLAWERLRRIIRLRQTCRV